MNFKVELSWLTGNISFEVVRAVLPTDESFTSFSADHAEYQAQLRTSKPVGKHEPESCLFKVSTMQETSLILPTGTVHFNKEQRKLIILLDDAPATSEIKKLSPFLREYPRRVGVAEV